MTVKIAVNSPQWATPRLAKFEAESLFFKAATPKKAAKWERKSGRLFFTPVGVKNTAVAYCEPFLFASDLPPPRLPGGFQFP